MNCVSLLLNQGAEEGNFGYQENCDKAKLTHLCFADDLLIFTDGSVSSVLNTIWILQIFEDHSGLAMNINKTAFYSAGLS